MSLVPHLIAGRGVTFVARASSRCRTTSATNHNKQLLFLSNSNGRGYRELNPADLCGSKCSSSIIYQRGTFGHTCEGRAACQCIVSIDDLYPHLHGRTSVIVSCCQICRYGVQVAAPLYIIQVGRILESIIPREEISISRRGSLADSDAVTRCRRGRHLVEVGGAAVGLGRSLVGAHIDVVARLRRQAHGGVVHGADNGPAGRGLAMGHHGDLPLRLVGKLRRVALPCVGYGGVRHLGGGNVHHGGQGVVGGEALAHPWRSAFAAAVVLHIDVVRCGGAEACQAGGGLGEASAGLGHGVQRGIGQAAGGAQYVVEVVGLCGLGLLPGGRGRALAGLHHADVGHRAALAHGAEAVAEPLAAAVVVAAGLAVGAHVHVVHGVGRQTRGVVGGGGALIGVGAVVGRQGGGVKLGAGHQHLVAAQVVGRGHGLPGQRGLRLGDVRGLHGGHRRAGVVGLAVLEAELRQEILHAATIADPSHIARRGAADAVEST